MIVSKKKRHVEFLSPSGKKVHVDCLCFSRGGTLSPETVYIIQGERLVSPFEQAKRGWRYTFGTFLGLMLDYDLLREELGRRDWLLKNIPKEWTGKTILIPF